jgi:hypothetical protein
MPPQIKRNNEWGTREDQREWTRLTFEHYKQLATLSGVSAAVVLTIFEQRILKEDLVRYALGLFPIAAVASIIGMLRLLVWVPYPPPKGDKPGAPLLAQVATYLLSGAVASLVFATVEFPRWVAYAVIAAYVVFFLYIFFGGKISATATPWLVAKASPWLRVHVAPKLPKRVQGWLRRWLRRR